MELKELQEKVDEWIKSYGVRYFNELTNMTILTEEVGELARVMARKYGEQSFKEGEKDNLADEMADILWVLTCLANQTGVDLTEAMEINFAKKTARDLKGNKNNPENTISFHIFLLNLSVNDLWRNLSIVVRIDFSAFVINIYLLKISFKFHYVD